MSLPNSQDLQAPFDPTQYITLTGAQLLQLITGASPAAGNGLIVGTVDSGGNPNVPNANTTTKWQNYIWLRFTATSAIPYVWNPAGASDATYLQWQTVAASSIGQGTIVDSMIASNTITADKIASVYYSSITGAPASLPPSGNAGGSLNGTYPNPTIANGAITAAMFAAGAVNNAAMAANSVAFGNMIGDGISKDMLRAATGTPTNMEWFTPPSIFTSGAVVTTANQYKVPQVATAGAGDTGTWQMVTPETLGRILQIVEVDNTSIVTSSGALANVTSVPNYNATGNTPFFNSGAFTKIDTTGASKLLIEVFANVSDGTASYVFVGLYNATGATAPLAGCAVGTASVHVGQGYISYLTAANPADATYYVTIGSTSSSTTKTNTADGTNNNWGIMTSKIRITEYI